MPQLMGVHCGDGDGILSHHRNVVHRISIDYAALATHYCGYEPKDDETTAGTEG